MTAEPAGRGAVLWARAGDARSWRAAGHAGPVPVRSVGDAPANCETIFSAERPPAGAVGECDAARVDAPTTGSGSPSRGMVAASTGCSGVRGSTRGRAGSTSEIGGDRPAWLREGLVRLGDRCVGATRVLVTDERKEPSKWISDWLPSRAVAERSMMERAGDLAAASKARGLRLRCDERRMIAVAASTREPAAPGATPAAAGDRPRGAGLGDAVDAASMETASGDKPAASSSEKAAERMASLAPLAARTAARGEVPRGPAPAGVPWMACARLFETLKLPLLAPVAVLWRCDAPRATGRGLQTPVGEASDDGCVPAATAAALLVDASAAL